MGKRVALALSCLLLSGASVELDRVLEATPLSKLSVQSVGEPRYLAASQLLTDDRGGFVQVLDLESRSLIRAPVDRGALERIAAHPRGLLVSYRPDRVGLLLQAGRSSHYAEIGRDGELRRSTPLGDLGVAGLQLIGTDPITDRAYFAAITDHPQLADSRQLVIRELALDTLAITDLMKLPMRRRTSKSGYETWLQVHPSGDFRWFAAVEYAEDGIPMDAAKIWVIDTERFHHFSVEAPSTIYDVAFDGDGRLFLASNQRGSLTRVDLASERIDKTAFGLKAVHHLALHPDSGRLYAIGSSVYWASLELPDLRRRRTGTYSPEVREHVRYLFGGGAVSSDGRFFAVEGDHSRSGEPREIFILRLE